MERLKPVDVRNAAFGKPPPGRRGYDESEVDAFLDRVEKTLSQLYHELALLRGEPTTPGGVGGRQLALPSGLNGVKNANGHSANGHSANGHGAIPDGPGPGEEAILAELDQIKLRLARIETAVTTTGRPAYNNGFGGY